MTPDYVLMNPPYDGSLHLKILSTIIRLKIPQCINLSPIRWLQDPLAPYKKGHDFDAFISVRKHLPELDVIDVKNAQNVFNARIPIDLGIYNISEHECNPYSLHTSLINKLTKFNSENPCPLEFNKKNGWRVRLPNVTCSSAANTGIKETTLKTLICFDGLHDGILVVGRQYWSHGMPTMIAMEAPFDDYLAFIEDDMGIEPSDKPTPELYKDYDD